MTEKLYNAPYNVYYTEKELDDYLAKHWDKTTGRDERGWNKLALCIESFFWGKSRMEMLKKELMFHKFL